MNLAISPTLSTVTTTNSTVSATSTSASGAVSATSFNYTELFDDIDWGSVSLIDIENEWRGELEQIEKDNVQALMDSTSKAQMVLPAVYKAIDDISKLSEIYDDYTNSLRLTGLEIQQIESLNRGLETQTKNLEILSEEVQKIISLVALPDGILEILQSMPLDVPASIPKIEDAAQSLYNLLNVKFEGGIQDIKAISDRLRYYNEQHDQFAKRLVKFFTLQFSEMINKQGTSAANSARGFGSSYYLYPSPTANNSLNLSRHDEIYSFLSIYKPLILLCRYQCPREHLEICTQFQNSLSSLLSKDLLKLFESLKTSHLLKRPNPDPSSLFINPNSKVQQFSLITGRTSVPSNKNFSAMQLLRIEDLPFLGDNEFVYPDQALQFIILILAMNMNYQRKMTADLLLGYSIPDNDPNAIDLKISKKLLAIQGIIYASLGERLPVFIDQCIKLDESSAIDLLAVMDVRVPQCLELTPMFGKILEAIQQKVYNYSELFLESQIEAIKATKYSAKKRSGIFVYVETFPRFVSRIESILSACGIKSNSNNFSVRSLIDRYYEKIGQAIFDSFTQLSSEVEESDEKGLINGSVMTIENSHFLFEKFTKMNSIESSTSTSTVINTSTSTVINSKKTSSFLEPILRSSRTFYETSLISYARLSIYRVLGRYADYFEGLNNLLKNTAPEEVAFTTTYSKASVKKILLANPFKELKKSIDLLHQRTLKHFNSQLDLQEIVWKALRDDFVARERGIQEGLGKVFAGAADVKLDHSIEQVGLYFIEVSKRNY